MDAQNQKPDSNPAFAAPFSRRRFLGALGGALAAGAIPALPQPLRAGEAARKRGMKLGFDNFAVRDFGFKAPQLLDYAAELKVDTLFISDLYAFDNHGEAHLGELRAKASDLGIEILVGTGGICPTARRVIKDFGSPEEHLKLAIRIAKALGSPVARCYLGSREDRQTPGGIEEHIKSTVAVCKAARAEALASGVKIAVENHAGDLQAWELVTLIEEAGKDYVGANLDSGNATWTLEDPLRHLEILGPYAVCSSLRDSMVWETAEGATVQWTAMGDGLVDWKAYFDRWQALCPKTPVQLELISGFNVAFPYLKADFWKPYPKARAGDLAAFLALAKRGQARKPFEPKPDEDRKEATRRYQKEELEKSLRYCKEILGLGLR